MKMTLEEFINYEKSMLDLFKNIVKRFMYDLFPVNKELEEWVELFEDFYNTQLANKRHLRFRINGDKEQMVDYRGKNLRGVDLCGADLNKADLSNADLSRANLHWADLNEANLQLAKLNKANMHWVKLNKSDLREADLREADLHGADLSEADLRGAKLSGADLGRANLRYALGDGKLVKSFLVHPYHVVLTKDVLAIGYEQHLIEDWMRFSDARISKMDEGVLEFWKMWKPIFMEILKESKRL